MVKTGKEKCIAQISLTDANAGTLVPEDGYENVSTSMHLYQFNIFGLSDPRTNGLRSLRSRLQDVPLAKIVV